MPLPLTEIASGSGYQSGLVTALVGTDAACKPQFHRAPWGIPLRIGNMGSNGNELKGADKSPFNSFSRG